MSSEIKTQSGRSVGSWDGADIQDLQQELDRIRQQLRSEGSTEKLIPTEMPHRDQLPADLQSFAAYPIWGCDRKNLCLCGARANRAVSVEDVRQYSLIDHH